MRRFLTTFVSCTLASLASLAGAADAPVMMQVTIPDGQRLVKHFQASVIGRLWNDPALAALRVRADEMMPMLEAELGFQPLALPDALTAAQATLFGLPDGATPAQLAAFKKTPEFRLQTGLGELAAKVFARLKSEGDGTPVDLPGVAEAIRFAGQQVTLARIDQQLLLATRPTLLVPSPIAPSPHDLTFHFDGKAVTDTVRRSLTPDELAKAEDFIQALHRFQVPVDGHLDITPTHNTSHIAAKTTLPFLIPIDLTMCARLPANAYAVNLLGLDGGQLWDDLIAPLFSAAAKLDGKDPADALAIPNQQLAKLGATATLTDLIRSIRGSFLFAQTPGAPLPGYTMAIPRSPALDQLLGVVLKQIGNELPAEGESVPLAIPDVPLPIHLVRDGTHWVVTSDGALGATWATNADGRWFASPLGKLALQKADPKTFALTVSDTAAEMRAMQGYLSMWLGMMPLEPKEKQAVMRAFTTLIANAGLSHEIVHQRGDLLVSEGESLIGGSSVVVVAIIAAIAIPNLIESRVVSNEAAAATSLKSGVFPALIQFQAGGYRDRDLDNVGEYGFFSEMSGGPIIGNNDNPQLRLLAETWNSPMPEMNGYRFALYLPDGKGGAVGAADQPPVPVAAAADAGERFFVAYAWPADGDSGRKVFAILNSGQVYVMNADEVGATPPAWNAVFGGEGKGWQDQPAWPLHQRRNAGPRPVPQPQPAPDVEPAF